MTGQGCVTISAAHRPVIAQEAMRYWPEDTHSDQYCIPTCAIKDQGTIIKQPTFNVLGKQDGEGMEAGAQEPQADRPDIGRGRVHVVQPACKCTVVAQPVAST